MEKKKEYRLLQKILTNNFLFLILIIIVIGYYASTQIQISYNNGIPYDSEYYFKVAEQVAQGKVINAEKPFVYRIGLPFLVGKIFPHKIIYGFSIFNLFFGILTVGILYRYLAFFLKQDLIVKTLTLAYIVNPNAPFRQVFYYPVQTDPAALFFILVILYICRKGVFSIHRTLVLTFLGFIGTFFREIVVFALLVHFISQVLLYPLLIKRVLLSSLPFLIACMALVVSHFLVKASGAYTFSGHLIESFNRLLDNFSMYPLAWLITFGPSIIFILLFFNRSTIYFFKNNLQLPLFSIGIAFGAMISGWHVDRFIFWSFPTVLVLIGYVIENNVMTISRFRRGLILVPLFIAHVFAHRIYLNIPDDPYGFLLDPGNPKFLLFAPYGENTILGQTFAAYMTTESRHILIFQFFLLAAYLFLVSKYPMIIKKIKQKGFRNKIIKN